jgi:hypothetical protein
MRDDVPSPKMPIPGAAGAAITAALAALAVHAGEAELTIKKVRGAAWRLLVRHFEKPTYRGRSAIGESNG